MAIQAIKETLQTPTYCVLDLETTGVKMRTVEILQVGIIIADQDLDPIYEYIVNTGPHNMRDGIFVEPMALKVNKIDLWEHSKTAKTYDVVAKEVLDILTSSKYKNRGNKLKLIGHNVAFDEMFLSNIILDDFRRYVTNKGGYDTAFAIGLLKDMGLLPAEIGEEPNLTDLAKFYGAPKDMIDGAHNALTDCKLTIFVLKKMRESMKGIKLFS